MTEGDISRIEKIIHLCDDCKFATCEQCEINYGDVYAIKHLYEENNKKQKELELKDKVIEETVKMIEEYTGSCPFDMYDWNETNCDEGSNCENVKVCWKQYFINKVKENKEL